MKRVQEFTFVKVSPSELLGRFSRTQTRTKEGGNRMKDIKKESVFGLAVSFSASREQEFERVV